MTIKISFAAMLFFLASQTFSQETKETPSADVPKTKVRYLEFGLGMPSIYFRDRTSSSLAYKGTGLGAIHFAGSRQNSHDMYGEWNVNARLQSAKPAIKNVTSWNKPADIYGIDFMYRKLKGLKLQASNKWHFFAGASLGSNLQLAVIPSANNTLAYNFSWLQLGLEGMIKRDFSLGTKTLQFTNQTSLAILGLNVRPLSYVGLPPQEIIWSQDKDLLSSVFAEPRVSSLHNNIALKNDIGLDVLFKKSKLGLRYSCYYQYNRVSVNSLNSIISSISITYAFKLKNK